MQSAIMPQLLRWELHSVDKVTRMDRLMSSYKPARVGGQHETTEQVEASSRLAHEEAIHEREMLNIRNFGYRWLKPMGVMKTMGQLEEELHEGDHTFDEYNDEDAALNQNNPLEEHDTTQDIISGEEEDLDEEVQDGASFEVEEDSYTEERTPSNTARSNTIEANSARLRGLVPQEHAPEDHEEEEYMTDEDSALESAEEGSIGVYTSEEEE